MPIVGMAGHVDHGKSALVAALTGTNPDRWLEERLRGMTLDLGFAHLSLDDGLEAGIVDVPGHERLLHNMLAGAAGMDVVLLAIDANEGVMPQTLEHLDILRYLNVRRLFNFVEESILEGTQWVVFEPNDPRLWDSVKRNVSAFLRRVWRDGALFGLTSAEAFFVKCDAENNTQDTIDIGQLIIDVGIAPVKPAEFVVFRIAQFAGGAAVSE